MKKKVYFILGSLRAGGSERVFWLLSQYFNKDEYDVSLILLDTRNPFFSPQLDGVKVIDLKSIKASRSFFKLYRLIKAEKPYAIFTTGGYISTLVSILSLFVKIPFLIGRESSVIDLMVTFEGPKEKILDFFIKTAYRRITIGVCQSDEVKESLANKYHIPLNKLVVIPNPVIPAMFLKENNNARITEKKLIVIARLSKEKGIFRLLEIFKTLPLDYSLTIAGDGPLHEQIKNKIVELQISGRVHLVGLKDQISQLIASHDVLLLTSYTEGFPNAVVEALSVGIPVVSFRVGGIQEIIKNGFNGYIVEQDDLQTFKEYTIKACNQYWDADAIRKDVNFRFGIDRVIASYESLIA